MGRGRRLCKQRELFLFPEEVHGRKQFRCYLGVYIDGISLSIVQKPQELLARKVKPERAAYRKVSLFCKLY